MARYATRNIEQLNDTVDSRSMVDDRHQSEMNLNKTFYAYLYCSTTLTLTLCASVETIMFRFISVRDKTQVVELKYRGAILYRGRPPSVIPTYESMAP